MEEIIEYQEPKCADVFDLTERELRRLHGMLQVVTYRGKGYRSDSVTNYTEETQKWARDQINHFHKAITSPVVFHKESK